jgi:superfamily I DNA/RNA helicase
VLSEAQQQAVTTPGHVLIPACPGAGKTTVLKHRAEFLLRSDPTARLAAATFTSAAAASLEERIARQYPAGASRLTAGTFHRLCNMQLRRSLGSEVKILKEGSRLLMIRRAVQSSPHSDAGLQFDDYKAAIDEWGRQLDPVIPPADSSPTGFVYRAFEKAKRAINMIDNNDSLRLAVRGMRAGTVAPHPVRFLFVDEFQDSNEIQLLWVLEHVKAGAEVTVVGDDDQCIFSFQGALGYKGMLQFEQETNATRITLDRTFRCPLQILQPAAVLIAGNPARMPKRLVTANRELGVVETRMFESHEAEATACVEAIIASGCPEKWAVLARTNAQLDLVDCAIGNRFPYTRSSSDSFWDLRGPLILLGMAESLATGNLIGMQMAFGEIGLSERDKKRLEAVGPINSPNALKAFCALSLPKTAEEGMLGISQRMTRDWVDLVASGSNNDLKMALNGMASFLLRFAKFAGGGSQKNTYETTEDAENKQKRMRRILHGAARQLGSMKGTLRQRIAALSRKQDKDEPGAVLMTLHKSKGLEFDYVWILGCESGVIPSARADSSIDEERRLFYVGITRCMRNLTISYTEGKDRGPSPFLKEAELLGSNLFSQGERAALG